MNLEYVSQLIAELFLKLSIGWLDRGTLTQLFAEILDGIDKGQLREAKEILMEYLDYKKEELQ